MHKERRRPILPMAIEPRPGTGAVVICIVTLSLTLFGLIGSTAEASDNLFSNSIDAAARANSLPPEILNRLLWVESGFHPMAVSPAGAEGVAQFMPATAAERGLVDPFAPEQAIPEAAKFLADLTFRFGNIGLGLAAYNAGPGRVARWLEHAAGLPYETRQFVIAITGYSPEEWASAAGSYMVDLGPRRASVLLSSLRIPQFRLQHARMLPIVAQSGRPLPGLEASGQPLPFLAKAGRPLAVLQGSGRRLAVYRQE